MSKGSGIGDPEKTFPGTRGQKSSGSRIRIRNTQRKLSIITLADLEFKVKLGQHDLQTWRPGGVRLVSPVEVGECLPQVYPPMETTEVGNLRRQSMESNPNSTFYLNKATIIRTGKRRTIIKLALFQMCTYTLQTIQHSQD
jgi:hypothetical protein